jgi:heterodisulfide reductase subunit C
MQLVMDELRNKAKELIESSAVKVVIGYEQGTANKTRALFVEKAEDASKLIFDSRCIMNLATYITKKEIREKGRMGIVATVPVMRSIIQLASEYQVTDNILLVLGITPESKMIEFNNFGEVETYIHQFQIEIDARNKEMLDKLDKMTASERWKFWIEELAPCFKCYACRAACPMCYCPKCTVEQNQPQWIPVPSHKSGNLEWHFMRAMHMAGRCVDCGACAQACPISIPLNLLTRKMIEDMKAQFGEYKISVKKENAMSTFKPEDSETFIR